MDRLAGFAELEPNGHIDRVYVSADHQGQGVGRALIAKIVAEARRLGLVRLFVEVSITARPFFESQGFTVVTPQTVVCRGVEFVNYRMERMLGEPDAVVDRQMAAWRVSRMPRINCLLPVARLACVSLLDAQPDAAKSL
jgi:GNAT superfamily N-acetyltransferase